MKRIVEVKTKNSLRVEGLLAVSVQRPGCCGSSMASLETPVRRLSEPSLTSERMLRPFSLASKMDVRMHTLLRESCAVSGYPLRNSSVSTVNHGPSNCVENIHNATNIRYISQNREKFQTFFHLLNIIQNFVSHALDILVQVLI
jgi:hypothetical protein